MIDESGSVLLVHGHSEELYDMKDFYRQRECGTRKLSAKKRGGWFQTGSSSGGKWRSWVLMQVTTLALIQKFLLGCFWENWKSSVSWFAVAGANYSIWDWLFLFQQYSSAFSHKINVCVIFLVFWGTFGPEYIKNILACLCQEHKSFSGFLFVCFLMQTLHLGLQTPYFNKKQSLPSRICQCSSRGRNTEDRTNSRIYMTMWLELSQR